MGGVDESYCGMGKGQTTCEPRAPRTHNLTMSNPVWFTHVNRSPDVRREQKTNGSKVSYS